jgi:hypothetical protein
LEHEQAAREVMLHLTGEFPRNTSGQAPDSRRSTRSFRV